MGEVQVREILFELVEVGVEQPVRVAFDAATRLTFGIEHSPSLRYEILRARIVVDVEEVLHAIQRVGDRRAESGVIDPQGVGADSSDLGLQQVDRDLARNVAGARVRPVKAYCVGVG